MTASYDTLHLEVVDRVATITLDRPERRNAFVPAMGEEPTRAYRTCEVQAATSVQLGAAELVLAEAPRFVNGIGFTPDGADLLLTATVDAELWSHPLAEGRRGLGGRLRHRARSRHPDGLAVSPDGVWVALTSGERVDLVAWDASRALPHGAFRRTLCLGGWPGDELYVTAARAGAVPRLRRP